MFSILNLHSPEMYESVIAELLKFQMALDFSIYYNIWSESTQQSSNQFEHNLSTMFSMAYLLYCTVQTAP